MTGVVLIAGTNCTGKTTLAKAIISHFGGGVFNKQMTVCASASPRVAFVGKYEGKYGGVDGLNSVKKIEPIIQAASEEVDIVFLEGLKLHSFGIGVQRCLFAAKNNLYVFLYADASTINSRLAARSNSRVTKQILLDQQHTLSAAKKFAQIGARVLCFNTGTTSTEDIKNNIIKEILKWDVTHRQGGAPK